MFDWVAEWVINVIETLGYLGLTVLVALENIFPPIPSELHLAAGRVSHRARPASPSPLVLVATTLGSLLGALLLYGIGMAAGQRGIRRLFERYGHWALLTPDDLIPIGELVRPLRSGCRLHRSSRPGGAVTGVDPRRLPPDAPGPVSAPDRFRQRAVERRARLNGLGSRRKLAPDRGIRRLASVPRHRRRSRPRPPLRLATPGTGNGSW